MFHLDNNSGIDVMPGIKQTLSRLTKWFTEGDSQTPPSYPGADWFNIVQAELLNVLKGAEIGPDKAKLNQLSSSIKKMILSEKVKLSSAVNSSAEDQAATSLAVKNTYDLAFSANNLAITANDSAMQANHKIDDLKQKFNYSNEYHQTEVSSPNKKTQFLIKDDKTTGLYSLEKKDWLWAFSDENLIKGSIDASQIKTYQNKNQNGFIKLHGGIILQWLRATTTDNGFVDVGLPISFPTAIFSVIITEADASSWLADGAYSYGFDSKNSNNSKIRIQSREIFKNNVRPLHGYFSLLAIGH